MLIESAKELLEKLNLSDECSTIEAKRASKVDRALMETVCAFSNEPNLGGGYILLGIEYDSQALFPSYIVCGTENPDKLQLDLSTQCADMFNVPIRPEIKVEMIDGKNVVLVFVPELAPSQKPVYFKPEGLPRGAFRRIGSSDQRCTDDDLFLFYNKEDSLDSSIIKDTSLDDISEEALWLYRKLRSNLNPYAEELQYDDLELLQSLGCVKKEDDKYYLTYAGLLVFGKRQSLRRLLPMVRVDYIRVPGNEWVADPENRFTTVDMRGPLIELVQRAFNAVTDDLPSGFLLPEGALQANSIGLPSKVLREAIVNAFIHRTYRENQPIQIIRYGNRLEIKNPGFSLKPEEQMGDPGSRNRNPFIAAIFHETNLAETKGSGIRTMRTLMEKANLMPPTFESDHANNQFTARLLLHHFLNESDIKWLMLFNDFDLTDSQKRAIIFVREVGAIDNQTYRQLNRVDILKASSDLRGLREKGIVLQKGKGRNTYYMPNHDFVLWEGFLSEPVPALSEPVLTLSALLPGQSTPLRQSLLDKLPLDAKEKLEKLGKRSNDKADVENMIIELCREQAMSLNDLSILLGKREKYLLYNFIKPLREKGRITYTRPEMPNHPQQAYRTVISFNS